MVQHVVHAANTDDILCSSGQWGTFKVRSGRGDNRDTEGQIRASCEDTASAVPFAHVDKLANRVVGLGSCVGDRHYAALHEL